VKKLTKPIIAILCLLSLVGCSGAGPKGRIPDNQRISTFFTMGEAIHSDYAKKHGIDNYPRSTAIEKNIIYTAQRMDKIRRLLNRPIIVSSWYRSPRVNQGVRGSQTSAHLDGLAVDFALKKGQGKQEVQRLKKRAKYDQLIYYPRGNRVHIGFRKDGKNERQEYMVK